MGSPDARPGRRRLDRRRFLLGATGGLLSVYGADRLGLTGRLLGDGIAQAAAVRVPRARCWCRSSSPVGSMRCPCSHPWTTRCIASFGRRSRCRRHPVCRSARTPACAGIPRRVRSRSSTSPARSRRFPGSATRAPTCRISPPVTTGRSAQPRPNSSPAGSVATSMSPAARPTRYRGSRWTGR